MVNIVFCAGFNDKLTFIISGTVSSEEIYINFHVTTYDYYQ